MLVSRAEHVGSLKRPAVLLQKRSDFQAGKCSAEELKAVEDESIAEAVRLQLNLGLDTITDGEYRRYVLDSSALWSSLTQHHSTMFYDGLFDCLDGFKVINDRKPLLNAADDITPNLTVPRLPAPQHLFQV